MQSMHKNYGKHSTLQKSIVSQAIPYLEASLEKMDALRSSSSSAQTPLHETRNEKDMFAIADYGSATGQNSREAVRSIISHVLKRSEKPPREFLVSHVDLPSTDWPSLFESVQKDRYGCEGIKNESGGGPPKIFTAAYGRSFFEQVLPSNSVDVGISFTAAHFLSRTPVLLKDHLTVVFSPDLDEQRAFKEQARLDWTLFLENRAKELRPGGHLLVSLITRSDDAHVLKLQDLEEFGVMEEVTRRAQERKIITKEERSALTFPIYHRTRDDLETNVPPSLKVEVISDLLPLSFQESLQERIDALLNESLQPNATEEDKKKQRAMIYANLGCKACFAIVQSHFESVLLKTRDSEEVYAIIEWMKEIFVRTHLEMLSPDEVVEPIKPCWFSSIIVLRKQDDERQA